jgi:hypothetical protein
MRMLVFMLLLTTQAGALFAQSPRQAEPAVVSVGEVSLFIPAPNGFRDPSPSAPHLRRGAELATPPGNRFLVNFVQEEALRETLDGKNVTFNRYFLAQTLRGAENQSVPEQEFEKLRMTLWQRDAENLKALGPRINQLMEQTSQDLSRKSGGSIKLEIGDVVPLGVRSETESMSILGYLSRVSLRQAGTEESLALVNMSAVVLVKAKVLFLYTYSIFRGPEDIEWAKQAARGWADQVLLANR